jgi:hypothetical protein
VKATSKGGKSEVKQSSSKCSDREFGETRVRAIDMTMTMIESRVVAVVEVN